MSRPSLPSTRQTANQANQPANIVVPQPHLLELRTDPLPNERGAMAQQTMATQQRERDRHLDQQQQRQQPVVTSGGSDGLMEPKCESILAELERPVSPLAVVAVATSPEGATPPSFDDNDIRLWMPVVMREALEREQQLGSCSVVVAVTTTSDKPTCPEPTVTSVSESCTRGSGVLDASPRRERPIAESTPSGRQVSHDPHNIAQDDAVRLEIGHDEGLVDEEDISDSNAAATTDAQADDVVYHHGRELPFPKRQRLSQPDIVSNPFARVSENLQPQKTTYTTFRRQTWSCPSSSSSSTSRPQTVSNVVRAPLPASLANKKLPFLETMETKPDTRSTNEMVPRDAKSHVVAWRKSPFDVGLEDDQ